MCTYTASNEPPQSSSTSAGAVVVCATDFFAFSFKTSAMTFFKVPHSISVCPGLSQFSHSTKCQQNAKNRIYENDAVQIFIVPRFDSILLPICHYHPFVARDQLSLKFVFLVVSFAGNSHQKSVAI